MGIQKWAIMGIQKWATCGAAYIDLIEKTMKCAFKSEPPVMMV